jgi:hypothetical protein
LSELAFSGNGVDASVIGVLVSKLDDGHGLSSENTWVSQTIEFTSRVDDSSITNSSTVSKSKSNLSSSSNTRCRYLNKSTSSSSEFRLNGFKLGSDLHCCVKDSLASFGSTLLEVESQTSNGGVQKVIKLEDYGGSSQGLASLFSSKYFELSLSTCSSESCASYCGLPFTVSSRVSGGNVGDSGSRVLVFIGASVVGYTFGLLRCLQEGDYFARGSISLVGGANSACDGCGIDSLNEAINRSNSTKGGNLNWIVSRNFTEVVTSDGKHCSTVFRSSVRSNIGYVGSNDKE